MRHSEYEQRRRALEEQYHADAELLRAGYQAKLRALEMLWLASPDVAVLPARSAPLLPGETPASPAPKSTSPALLLPARPRGQVLNELETLLPSLPEVFDRRDVVRALGYEPSRASLHRAFSKLLEDRLIVLEAAAHSSKPSVYRKLPVPSGEPTGP
jgi:hypothetical protein